MASIRDEVKTGEDFVWTQSLEGVGDDFAFGLSGLGALGEIKGKDRTVLYRFPLQAFVSNQTEVTFTCPFTETIKWVDRIGEIVVMDILYTDTTNTMVRLSPTINIEVLEGITTLNEVQSGEAFSQGFQDPAFT